MSKDQQLALAHFGIGAGTVVSAVATISMGIPFWGPVISIGVGAAAHYVSSRILGTVRKNVDPDFEK